MPTPPSRIRLDASAQTLLLTRRFMDEGHCRHDGVCSCALRSSSLQQSTDELSFMKSACAAARAGDCARLRRILDQKPNRLHDDGVSGHTSTHSSSPFRRRSMGVQNREEWIHSFALRCPRWSSRCCRAPAATRSFTVQWHAVAEHGWIQGLTSIARPQPAAPLLYIAPPTWVITPSWKNCKPLIYLAVRIVWP